MAQMISKNFIEEDTCFVYGIEADTYEEAKELAYQLYKEDKTEYLQQLFENLPYNLW